MYKRQGKGPATDYISNAAVVYGYAVNTLENRLKAKVCEDVYKRQNHDNQKRSLQVTASVKDGSNITKVTADVKEMIEDKGLVPSEIDMQFAGENEEIMDAMGQMMLMLLVGFILVYLVMVAQFQSLRSPFILSLIHI